MYWVISHLKSVLCLTSAPWCFCLISYTTQRHTKGTQPGWTKIVFSHAHADGSCYVCVLCMQACTHLSLCGCVCEAVYEGTPAWLYMCVHACMCVCVCMGRTKSGRFGPRGDDKAIKLYVSHINCFDLFSSQTHGSMATRDILPNWKECSSLQNMRKWQARKLTVVSVCPLRGQNTTLCSLVFFALPISQ